MTGRTTSPRRWLVANTCKWLFVLVLSMPWCVRKHGVYTFVASDPQR